MLTTQFNINFLEKNSKKEFTLYQNIYDREYNEQGTMDYYDSSATGLKYDFSKFFENYSYGYGSEYRHDSGKFENNGSYSASTKGNYDNLSLYGNLGLITIKNINLSFFIRNDENKKTGSNRSNKIDLKRKFKFFDIGIGRNEGFRNPTIYELYGTDNYGYSGNKNLKAEKNISKHIYLSSNFRKHLTLSIRGFKSFLKDQIEYKSNKYVNRSDDLELKQSGINTELNFKKNNNHLNFFISLLSSEKIGGSPQLRRPERNYGFNLSKSFNTSELSNFNVNLKYNHYGKHFDTHSSTFSTIEMDSTDIVDLTLSKKYKKYDIRFILTNLLNEKYQRPHGFSQNGRLFNINLKTSF